MKLSVNVPITHSRATLKSFNNVGQLYAKTFGLQISMEKTGLRFRSEHGHFDVLPTAGGGRVELDVTFPVPNDQIHPEDRGAATCLLSTYMLSVIDEATGIKLNGAQTDLVDSSTLNKWGVWALKQIFAKHPTDFVRAMSPQAKQIVTPEVEF